MPTNRDWLDIFKAMSAVKMSLSTISLLYDGEKKQEVDLLLCRTFDLFLEIHAEAMRVNPRKHRALSALFYSR